MLKGKLQKLSVCGVLLATMSAPVLANESANQVDPWEGFNRTMFSFNEGVDKYAVKPLTQGYQYVMPDVAETGVSNFFANLRMVRTLLNNVLQFKLHNAAEDVSRLVANTTFGIGGIFDVATPMGIPHNDEDFGQTLGAWGVGSSHYLVLPFIGPTNPRDAVGFFADSMVDPVYHMGDTSDRNVAYGVRLLSDRGELLKAEELVSGDRYLFVRDAYLQRREFMINDGEVTAKDEDF